MMRSLAASILIVISIVLVSSAKTGGPRETMDVTPLEKERPTTDVKRAGTTRPQKIVAEAETQEAYARIQSEQKVAVNPMVKKMLETDEGDLRGMGKDLKGQTLDTLIRMKGLSMTLTALCVAIGVIILLFMLAARHTCVSGVAYVLANLGYNVTRVILFTISLAGAIAWFGLRYNFLAEMGAAFLGALFLLLFLSSTSLKLYDFNTPVWNRMLSSLVWPIIPNVIVAF
jgi:hypothetical protein